MSVAPKLQARASGVLQRPASGHARHRSANRAGSDLAAILGRQNSFSGVAKLH